MFYLFFTTPADNKQTNSQKRPVKKLSRNRSIVTWFLLCTWFVLMSFGAISTLSPKWLEEVGRLGKEGGSRVFKDYGDNFLRQKNYYKAAAQYEEALRIQPDNVGVLVNLAIVYAQIGDPVRGLKTLGNALKIKTDQRGNIYYNIAEILESQNKTDEAIRYYEMTVGSEFNQGLVYRRLGSIYFTSGQYEKAREAFEKLLAIQTDPRTPYLNMLQLGIAVYENDTTHLKVITDQLGQAINAENLSNYDLESIRRAQQNDREIAKTHNHLGAIYAQLGEPERSANHFRQSLDIWPGNIDAKLNLPKMEQILKIKNGSGLSQR